MAKRLRRRIRALRAQPLSRQFLILVAIVLVPLLLVGAWLIRPFWQLSGQFGDAAFAQPSRLYGRSLSLAVGGSLAREDLVEELGALEYRDVGAGSLETGGFRLSAESVEVALRSFPTPEGRAGGAPLRVELAGKRIARLVLGGEEVRSAVLEPPLLSSYFSDRLLDRRPIEVGELPDHLVRAVLAAEDDRFFGHSGLSFSGILRAAWVNVSGREVRQGGSTLTQQLVKNLYLTQERTFSRKIQEAVLAVILELRYDKRSILQAYFNEIYLGRSAGVNLMGVGAAARAYFGKDPADLTLAESAVIAGMIRAPADYSPLSHPERSRERRDFVLNRLLAMRWADATTVKLALESPIVTSPQRPSSRRAPYFADLMAREAAARFGITELDDASVTLFSTLDWRDQRRAEDAIAWGLATAEKGWQKGQPGRLQAALVSVDPKTGGILAYVGGRAYGESQFDRAGQALRQAGSAFKPVVYAAAFEAGTASPATLLEDAPLTVTLANTTWNPHNDDNDYRGWVSARRSIEQSLNVPTARLALQTGLKETVALARALGITSPLQPVPALALGAFEVTPLELATVYATLAAGGVRPPVHGLTAALDAGGQRLIPTALPPPERALSGPSAYLVTSVLQGVLDRGTGAAVRRQGLSDRLAGKTGTTNGRRDSWFGGYAPTRATLVWVGLDDNSQTRLSGARAALPIWGRFTLAVRPRGGFPEFSAPPGVISALIDPQSGELATEECSSRANEVFLQGHPPRAACHLHGGWYSELAAPPPPGVVVERPAGDPDDRRGFRSWLRRVLGKERERDQNRPPPP